MNKYIKKYLKNGIKTDVSFRLIGNTGRRIHNALTGTSKSSSKLDLLGIDVETYRKWIDWLFIPERNWKNNETDRLRLFVCLM